MAFWGVLVKPDKPYTLHTDAPSKRLRISQATLGDRSGIWTSRSVVRCSVGTESPVYICSLSIKDVVSCHLDLEFEESQDVVFSVSGPRGVHLAGYYLNSNNSTINACKIDPCGDKNNGGIRSKPSSENLSEENEYDAGFIDAGALPICPTSHKPPQIEGALPICPTSHEPPQIEGRCGVGSSCYIISSDPCGQENNREIQSKHSSENLSEENEYDGFIDAGALPICPTSHEPPQIEVRCGVGSLCYIISSDPCGEENNGEIRSKHSNENLSEENEYDAGFIDASALLICPTSHEPPQIEGNNLDDDEILCRKHLDNYMVRSSEASQKQFSQHIIKQGKNKVVKEKATVGSAEIEEKSYRKSYDKDVSEYDIHNVICLKTKIDASVQDGNVKRSGEHASDSATYPTMVGAKDGAKQGYNKTICDGVEDDNTYLVGCRNDRNQRKKESLADYNDSSTTHELDDVSVHSTVFEARHSAKLKKKKKKALKESKISADNVRDNENQAMGDGHCGVSTKDEHARYTDRNVILDENVKDLLNDNRKVPKEKGKLKNTKMKTSRIQEKSNENENSFRKIVIALPATTEFKSKPQAKKSFCMGATSATTGIHTKVKKKKMKKFMVGELDNDKNTGCKHFEKFSVSSSEVSQQQEINERNGIEKEEPVSGSAEIGPSSDRKSSYKDEKEVDQHKVSRLKRKIEVVAQDGKAEGASTTNEQLDDVLMPSTVFEVSQSVKLEKKKKKKRLKESKITSDNVGDSPNQAMSDSHTQLDDVSMPSTVFEASQSVKLKKKKKKKGLKESKISSDNVGDNPNQALSDSHCGVFAEDEHARYTDRDVIVDEIAQDLLNDNRQVPDFPVSKGKGKLKKTVGSKKLRRTTVLEK